MFCPNCGTKNDATAVKCGQCGFGLKSKAGASKFQGTVMMQGSAGVSATGSAKKPAPGAQLKGTMVGVAPPGIDELRKEAIAKMEQKGNLKPQLKGTMVGVAPPELEEARQQVAATKTASADAAKPAPSKLKGTMIGMVAPNFKDALRAPAGEKPAAAAQAPSPRAQPPRAQSPGSPGAPTAPAPRAPAPAQAMPSKLKGTMLGVAPPELQEELAHVKEVLDARANAALEPLAPAPGPSPLKPDFAGTMPSLGAPNEKAEAAPALDATTPAPRMSPFASGLAGDQRDEAFQQTQISSHPPPGAAASEAEEFPPPPTVPLPSVGAAPRGPIGQPGQASAGPQVPVSKSKVPLFALAALLLLALIGIFVVVGMSDEPEDPGGNETPADSGEAAEQGADK